MTKDQEAILQVLRDQLIANPHLRVGQLVANALPRNYCCDPYYVPDHELLRCLKAYPVTL